LGVVASRIRSREGNGVTLGMQYKPEIKHASGRYLRKPPLTAMPFFYSSGEEIRKGDRVLVHGEAGEVEFIADPAESPDDWFVKDQGGGIMVLELKVFGRIFITKPETDEHLTFVARQTER